MAVAERIEVADAPDRERYELSIDGEEVGYSIYRARPGLIAFVHTEVDERLEGRGLGDRLIRFALEDARARGLACSRGWESSGRILSDRRPRRACSTSSCASSASRRFSPREVGRVRAALTQSDAPRPAPGIVLPPRPRGRPPTTERPQCLPQRDHPINHHVADPPHGRVVDRDTAGRPRALTDQ